MKVFISKYALTQGIIEREMPEYTSERFVVCDGMFLKVDSDVHKTRDAAVKAAADYL